MSTIVQRYLQKFRMSGKISERGQTLVAGGGHATRVVRPHPVFVEEASGALKRDVDGNEIVDYVMGYGSLLLGHAHPEITEAVTSQLSKGTHMGTNTQLELRWAEVVKMLVPSADRVRFTASGTEATLLALRLARGFTGRRKLVKFREHFHGWHDYVSAGSGINTQVGIPDETLSTVIVLDPDLRDLERLLEHDNDVAAVILEPTGGHWGQFPLRNPGFLEEVRALTIRHGVVMIMDEVITGFRMSRGGAQERFGIHPDLTSMAKVVAGGMPGGALAGGEEIMDMFSRDHVNMMAHPGTWNANPVSAAAGVAALDLIAGEPINKRADAMASRLKQGLVEGLTRMEVTGHAYGIASIVHVVLGTECDCDGEICTLPHAALADAGSARRSEALKLAMLNEGVDMLGGLGFMVSSSHEEEHIDRTIEGFENALGALRDEGVV